MDVQVEKVMDRKRLAESLHSILDAGSKLMTKKEFDATDHARVKAIRVMGSALSAAVTMVQQETAQQRMVIVVERMKQLGYQEPKALEGKKD
jgi:hypothetical protein